METGFAVAAFISVILNLILPEEDVDEETESLAGDAIDREEVAASQHPHQYQENDLDTKGIEAKTDDRNSDSIGEKSTTKIQ